MHDARIARRYAQALFATALKFDVVRAVEDDLEAISRLMETDKSFRDFIMAPYTSREEKARIAEKVFGDRITALTMQVLRVMLEKRREPELPLVRDEFTELRRRHENVVHALVTSAKELDGTQRTALVAKLQASLGKTVEADFEVDPSLLGGLKVAYENNVLDGTVRGALQKLRERLRYDLLKQS
jgi:F-type H+-transporting ATPase subunit delta